MRHVLIIPVIVFALASTLIFFCGDSGLGAYRSLDSYRQRLADNVSRLEARNAALSADLSSLRTDPERAIVLARGLGMYKPGDEVVRLVGVPPRPPLYAVGDLLSMTKHAETRSAVFKAVAVGLVAALLAYAVIAARARRARSHGGSGR
jgi:hypothetical protein